MRLDMKLAQKLVMTPQLQQAIRLLQLSRLEMSQLVHQEMLENPVLEEVAEQSEAEEAELSRTAKEAEAPREEAADESQAIDVFGMKWDNYIDYDSRNEPSSVGETDEDGPSYEHTLSSKPNLHEHLMWQLGLTITTEKERATARVLIGNIDEDGYLRDFTLEEAASTAGVSRSVASRALKVIHEMDPPGVGARNLRECLLIQVRQAGLSGSLAEAILKNHMDALEKHNLKAIARGLRVKVEDVVTAVGAIESLEPKPGRPYAMEDTQYIIPDVYVVKKGDDYVIMLNDEGIPKLRISSFYKRIMRSDGDSATKEYIENKMRSAQWLLKSIEQRNKTIYRVAESIVTRQRDFFDKGLMHLKPMILRDVAEDISMHESTISRVTTNKFMHSPQGIFELKYFFSGGLAGASGEEHSSIMVRDIIEKVIHAEDPAKPLNDRVIVDMLKKKNISIARRTVAKYRCELKIPPANMRKRQH